MNSFDSYMTPRDRAESEALSCPVCERAGMPFARQEMTPMPEDQPMCGCSTGGNTSAYGLESCGGNYPLAMVYSPEQRFESLFDTPEEGLAHGTIFRSLCLPFLPGNCHRGGKC